VRVWDEAIEWGTPIALLWSGIAGLAHVAMGHSAKFSAAVFAFAGAVQVLTTGEEISVPDFEAEFGISWREIEAQLAVGDGPDREGQRQAARDLRALNGNIARAYVENERGTVALSYEQRIPDDIRPILVLDASIRVRQTYKDMLAHRTGFVSLPSAVKDYSDLKVHIWKTAGSKSAFVKNGADIVEGVVNTILSKPSETWLVVTHKPSQRVKNTEAQITAGLPVNVRPKVSFLTFGAHMATNDYSEVQNVMLAGQFFAPMSHYAAMTHAAQGRSVASGLVSHEEIDATKKGEIADVTLQALARGRCRKSNGSKAQAMDAYIIATVQSGIPSSIKTIFPNCQVIEWMPFKKELSGNVKLAVDYVRKALKDGQVVVSYKEIYGALEILQSQFSKGVSNTDDWKTAVVDMGCEIHRGARGALGVRLLVEQ